MLNISDHQMIHRAPISFQFIGGIGITIVLTILMIIG